MNSIETRPCEKSKIFPRTCNQLARDPAVATCEPLPRAADGNGAQDPGIKVGWPRGNAKDFGDVVVVGGPLR